MRNRLTLYILIGMLLGIIVGYIAHEVLPAQALDDFSDSISLITTAFIHLIKMIIAPLVFSTLVVGIAKIGNIKAIGRIGAKTLGWFMLASFISLALGLLMVNWLEPGHSISLALPQVGAETGIKASAMGWKDFVVHLIPESIFEAMSQNAILQIVIFALFFGMAMASMQDISKPLIDYIDIVAHVMLRVTSYVMNFAPVAVFAALAATVTKQGLSILKTYSVFMSEFYFSMFTLWAVLIAMGFLFLGKQVFRLVKHVREPVLLAFSTASSEAAYPKTLEQLERFGANSKIASFVLPIGYSFNLTGSMMYCTFATIFIAQAYGIHVPIATQITMLLILMVTSKGMAGIPRASLVIIAATLSQFNIPEAGLLLILGVDHFLDMGRSATNLIGNSIATGVIAKWEDKKE